MTSFTISPLTDHTGAEVTGLDFTQPIDGETRAALNKAFAEHHVLVMRGQHFSPGRVQGRRAAVRRAAAARQERAPRSRPSRTSNTSPTTRFVNGRRIIPGETFHTDHSNHPRPPKATTLFAVELPSSGGDTQYVNMHDAYDDLPETTKRRIDGLKAVHVYQSKYSPRPLGGLNEESRRNLPPPGVHPLVRTHPENGRKALFLNPVRMEAIVGMDDADALKLIDELMRARDAEEIRVSAQVAPRRLGDVGQPQRHAPGQSRLRHERAPLPLSPHAQGRSAGVSRGEQP